MSTEPENQYQLYLSSNGEVALADWQQIVHSLVTYGDSVWIPADYGVAPNLPNDIATRVRRNLNELIQADLVRLWSYEESADANNASVVLTSGARQDLKDQIDDTVFSETDALMHSGSPREIDTASRIIEYRHELWNLGLASLCNADGVVYGRETTRHGNKGAGTQYEEMNRKYCERLFEQFEIPSLVNLTCDDILKVRTDVSSFRRRIDKTLVQHPSIDLDDAALIAECRSLFKEYLEVAGASLQDRARLVNSDLVLNVVGIVLPVAGVGSIAMRFCSWLKNRGKYRFALYMHRLKEVGAQSVSATSRR